MRNWIFFWGLLAVAVTQSVTGSDAGAPEVISDSKTMELGNRYSVSTQKLRFVVKEEPGDTEFYAFRMGGKGDLEIRFFASEEDSGAFVRHGVSLQEDRELLVPLDTDLYAKKGFVLEIVNKSEPKEASFWLELKRQRRLGVAFDSNSKILVRFCRAVAVGVAMPEGKYLDGADYRLQFIAQSSLAKQQLTGFERFEMFINRGSNIPSEKRHDISASGNSGSGLIKTLNRASPFYCVGEKCEFTVTLVVTGVDHILFFPTVLRNGAELRFDHSLFLLEELEGSESVSYELAVPPRDSDWVLSLTPVEGRAEMLISPDSAPNSPELARFRASGTEPENLLISHRTSQLLGLEMSRIFVTFRNQGQTSAVFKFEARRHVPDSHRVLRTDVAEMGLVGSGQVVSFVHELSTSQTQAFSVRFTLQSLAGKAELLVKECLSTDSSCEVSEADFLAFQGGADESLRLTRVADEAVLLNFNCLRDGPGPQNGYPSSKSCCFAVGVHGQENPDPSQKGAFFKLEVRGQGLHQPLRFNEARILTLNRRQTQHFSFGTNGLDKNRDAVAGFRVIGLTGSAKLYFSRRNAYPSEADNDLALTIEEAPLAALHAVEKDGDLVVFGDFEPKEIYLTIVAQSFAVLDLYSYTFNYANQVVDVQEPAQFNHVMHRKMNQDDVVPIGSRTAHVQNFLIEVPMLENFIEPLVINLSSDVLGFHLCAQVNVVVFNLSQPCDFSSESESLEIPPETLRVYAGRKIGLSVQREIKGLRPDKEEIDFALTINTQDLSSLLHLTVPGRSYTYTSSNKGRVNIRIDLRAMQRTALLTLSSDDPLVYANLYASRMTHDGFLQTLDKFKFGFNVTDAMEYKRLHCEENCDLLVEVLSTSEEPSRFTLTYTIDSAPIVLKDGGIVVVPSSQELRFVHEPVDHKAPVSLNFFCEETSVVGFATVAEQSSVKQNRLAELLSESVFSFKSSIDRQNSIVIPRDLLSGADQKIVLFLLVPKFGIAKPDRDGPAFLQFFHASDRTRVDAHSSLKKLEPSKNVAGVVEKGDVVSYHFSLDRPQDFTVMLSVLSGEADLYLNKNMFNITSPKHFWRNAVNHRTDEIVVRKEDYSDVSGPISFSIGVFGREKAKYSLLVVPGFKNLITINFQHLIDMNLNKGEEYYFDLFNKNEKYATLLFSENGDIEVSALNFDEQNVTTDFLYLIEEERNYVQQFIFHKGDIPRKNLIDHEVELKTHVIVRVKPIDDNAHLLFLVYDPLRPIHVFSERRFTFLQNKDEKNTFVMDLSGEFEKVEIDLKLAFGSIDLYLSSDPNISESSAVLHKIGVPGHRFFSFKIDKVQQQNDIVIFDRLYLLVQSKEFSKFSILVRPQNKFKEIRDFETELVYPNPEHDLFLFHFLTEKAAKKTSAFSFFVDYVQHFGEKPEFFFIPEADVVLDKNAKMLAMPLLDLVETSKGDFISLEVRPEIRSGYFIIKIAQSPATKAPFKISLSLNNHRNLELNGLYQGNLSPNESGTSYSLFVPSAGEVRLITESCTNLAPNTAIVASGVQSSELKLEQNFLQSFDYVFIDDSTPSIQKSVKPLSLPVRRVLLEAPGVVRFKVGRQNESSGTPGSELSSQYFLMTEFRPKEKELFFKDYVEVLAPYEAKNSRGFSYKFGPEPQGLKITISVPKLKQQLLFDYPSLRKVSFRLHVDLFSDQNFDGKLAQCGMGALKELQTVRQSTEVFIAAKDISPRSSYGKFEVNFPLSDLEKFAETPTLNAFGSLSVAFFNNEDEEHHVTLNFKFASMPYFHAIIPSRPKAFSSSINWILLCFAMAALLSLLAIFYNRVSKAVQTTLDVDRKYDYAPASSVAPSRLEMSSFSEN